MKIENKIADNIDFEDIGVGDVFRYNKQIYMRIDYLRTTVSVGAIGAYYNAVNLESGALRGFDNYDLVTPLYDAKVVI